MMSKVFLRSLLFAGLCAFTLGLTAPAQAIVILSNLSVTSSAVGTSLGVDVPNTADRTKAVGLTVGANDLSFTSLTGLFSNPGITASELTGGIFSDLGGNPGNQLVALTPASVAAGIIMTNPVQRTFTAVGPFLLEANTSYWFVIDGPERGNELRWNGNNPRTEPTASPEVSYDGYRFSEDGGVSWVNSMIFNAVQIEASRIVDLPEPGTLALFGLGLLGLGIARRRVRAQV